MAMEAKDAKFEVADDIRVGRLLLLEIAAGSSARHGQFIRLMSLINKIICLQTHRPIRVEKLV